MMRLSVASKPRLRAMIRCGALLALMMDGGIGHAQSMSGPLLSRSVLFGDPAGVRTRLANDGITLSGNDDETLLGAAVGGIKHGATLQGLTTVNLQIDTGKAFGWPNGTVNVSALQIHGRSLSPYYLGDLQTASGTEAETSTRLWELWYDQKFDHGRLDVKIGQQSIDQEFIVSQYSGLFVNTMAGWPLLPSADLYAGGPAYPLSSLGARVRFKPRANMIVLLGGFDDNPPGGAFNNDPQSRDAGGTRFNTNTGALVIGEVQYAINQAGRPAELPGTYRLGFWYDTGRFPDPAIASNGVSLASPASSGVAALKRDNYSLYAVADQTVWASARQPARTINIFARVMGAPGDRNLIGFSFNGGVTMTDPLPGRPQDSAGVYIGVGVVGSAVAAYDRAESTYGGGFYPVQSAETLIEATYQLQVTPWWQVQPDIQYVINPGAGILNPAHPTRLLRNALVLGVRTSLVF
ncbi:MAG TPA: carbohydrate porin [Acidiphilium sp.]|nr:MAG: hypothetical protein B7Z67_00500 [Acidiphilium sp. 21-60-14]OYV92192.1 MAG: hypothetical protein B7Z57_01295 [Acidiphilium sp. 37-60-79]OZB40623.1 MAG: hypothetical protein B7X48_04515 [Acidiphilium sp. 34-60-192]HQT87442.1 carbohydrate porin [Acidiphilium sp.]HQU23148.1 carbohydrate porin [Acidiphilium sp.]